MKKPKVSGFARYEDVDDAYLESRSLQGRAGWVLLWALGVGAVISGDYFGWNVGLLEGGFWGLVLATAGVAVLYVCLVMSIAELSAALPHAGGFYSFVRSAFGPTGGYICGVTDTIEYVITPAVIVIGIGGYGSEFIVGVLGLDEAGRSALDEHVWVIWVAAYALFVWINILGVELTMRVGLVITGVALVVLVVFYAAVLASGAFDADLLFNVEADAGQSARWLPKGWLGVVAAVPGAIWFYLAIEQLPLAAEESRDAGRDMPRALLLGIATLLLLSVLTLVLNSGVGGGAQAIGNSVSPLVDGFRAVVGQAATWSVPVFALAALAGLIASFHAIIYAYGRVLFALSRAGYFPRWMSITGARRTPWVALIVGAVVGLGCAALLEFVSAEEDGGSAVAAALLNMAVFGAVLSYAMVLLAFIWLRLRRPDLERPYRSPLGIPGALAGLVLSLVALGATLADPEVRPGVIGVAIFLAAALVYYAVYSRFRLVAQAPEERAALAAETGRRVGMEDGEDR